MPKPPTPLKTRKAKTPTLYLKIRTTHGEHIVDCYLLRKDGAAHSCLLHGHLMFPEAAELLVTALGLPVERDHCPLPIERDSMGRPSDELEK